MIGIITALTQESLELCNSLEYKIKLDVSSYFTYYMGKLGDARVIVAICAQGKVNAAICTYEMIKNLHCTTIINMGIVGALDDELNVGDYVLMDTVAQTDIDASAVGVPLGLVSGINQVYFKPNADLNKKFLQVLQRFHCAFICGRIATNDAFIAEEGVKQRIKDNFLSDVCDMEAGAIAQVCTYEDVKFTSLKVVSDKANADSVESIKKSLEDICADMCRIVKVVVKELGEDEVVSI